MGSRIKKAAFLFALLILLASCTAHLKSYRPDPSNPIYTVAVLPFYNITNDVGGALALRNELQRRVEHRNYRALPLKEVDGLLMDRMGITLGHQLEMTDAMELGRTLNVDGVIYGWVLDFDDVTTGVYNVKKVRAGFKLVDAKTGRTVWAGGQGVKTVLSGGGKAGAGASIMKELLDRDDFTPDTVKGLEEVGGLKDWHYVIVGGAKKAEEAAVLALGEQLVTKAFGVHMWLESNTMFDLALRNFPSGPGFARHE